MILYDTWRFLNYPIIKFMNWDEANKKNMMYTYTDFIFMDLPEITFIKFIKFIVILNIFKIVITIQSVFFIYGVLCSFVKKEVRPIKCRGILHTTFIAIPWSQGCITYIVIKNGSWKKKKIELFLNILSILIWGKSRWSINNVLFIQTYWDNIRLGNQKFKYSFEFIIENYYKQSYKKHCEFCNTRKI